MNIIEQSQTDDYVKSRLETLQDESSCKEQEEKSDLSFLETFDNSLSQSPNKSPSFDELQQTLRNPKRSHYEIEFEDVADYPDAKRIKESDDDESIDHLFINYSSVFKTFLPRDQTMLKLQLAKLFANVEMKTQQQSKALTRSCNTETESTMASDEELSQFPNVKKEYEEDATYEHNYSIRSTEVGTNPLKTSEKFATKLSVFMEDLSTCQQKILDILQRRDLSDHYENFSRYVSSLLSMLPKERAFVLQSKIIEIITSECSDNPVKTEPNESDVA